MKVLLETGFIIATAKIIYAVSVFLDKESGKNKKIKKLVKYTNILREKTFGKSRFDFKISNDLGAKNDVDIFAYNCIVTEDGIEINEEVEIILT